MMVLGDASVVSWSKDSIYVSWKFASERQSVTRRNRTEPIRGYKIRYQAIGSSVVQYTRLIDRSVNDYEITHLHENTNYDICVLRMQSPADQLDRLAASGGPSTGLSAIAVACVTGTTSTDSLSVALGSTFGAFLALGFIVSLVLLAKWQHRRSLAKKFAELPLDNVYFATYPATAWPPDHTFADHGSSPDLANIYNNDITDLRSPSDDNQLPVPVDTSEEHQPRPSTSRGDADEVGQAAGEDGWQVGGGDGSGCGRRRSSSPASWNLRPFIDDLVTTTSHALRDSNNDDDDDDDADNARTQRYSSPGAPCCHDVIIASQSTSESRGKQPAAKSRVGIYVAGKNHRQRHGDVTSSVTSAPVDDVRAMPPTTADDTCSS